MCHCYCVEADPTSVGLDEQKWGFLGQKMAQPVLFRVFPTCCKTQRWRLQLARSVRSFQPVWSWTSPVVAVQPPTVFSWVVALQFEPSFPPPRKRHIFAGDFGLGNALIHVILKSWFVKISGRSKYTYTDISLLRRTCFCCQKSWMICIGKYIHFMLLWWWFTVLVLVLPSPKEVTSRIAKASLLIPSNTGGTNLQQLRSWLLWLVHLLW